MPTTDRPPLALRVARTFPASRERVFRAWTDPQAIKQWFIEPSEGRWTREPEVDARPGGRYRFTGESGGKAWNVHGTYRQVDPPAKLVFTWEWEDYPAPGDSGNTLVTVEFVDRDGRTEVVLTHEGFSTEAARQDHSTGWDGCFNSITRLLSQSA